MKREAGILMPISALDSPYGIGCFSKEAYDFVDFLAESGQRVWQILPLCPTSFGDSPYQSPCSFGGNPYFIDPSTLTTEGLLTEEECASHSAETEDGRIDYSLLYEKRYPLLRLAYERFSPDATEGRYAAFLTENSFWLEDYAFFSAIKRHLGGAPLQSWDSALRSREPETMEHYRKILADDIGFEKFLQYEFFTQWNRLRAYANRRGISILGDIPIYVSADSCDLWANPQLFLANAELCPLAVAGCPPDGFSPKGQLWGNPIYDWKAHKREGFSWWRQRISHALRMYDMIRIDHFRGFEAYYSIPYGAPDARAGHWERGIGSALFDSIGDCIPKGTVIAEDLGYMTEGVRELVKKCGFPGMKILQFGFDDGHQIYSSEYLPHNYTEHSVVYTGTHDNPTLMEWLCELTPDQERKLRGYIVDESTPKEELSKKLIALSMQSVSRLCIIPIQDYMGVGREGRMNVPSADSGNWSWRILKGALNGDLSGRIKELTLIGGRELYLADQ